MTGKMLPEFLGQIHPVYKTPGNAVILIGLLTMLTPLLGRKVGVWLIDAGSAGIVFSWFFVCWSRITASAQTSGVSTASLPQALSIAATRSQPVAVTSRAAVLSMASMTPSAA